MLPFSIRCSARVLRSAYTPSFRYSTTSLRQAKTVTKLPSRPAAAPATRSGSGRAQQVQVLATRILDAGSNEIYRNTSANGFIAASLGIMVLSYCGIFYLYSTRLWDDQVAKGRGLHWLVPKSYQITMICWGVFAAYAFSRTIGIVRSIKLVRGPDKILLETTIRRPIPFLRAETHLCEPHTLVINRSKLFSAADTDGMITAPEGASFVTRLTRTLFYAPFHNTRKSLGGVGLVPIQLGPDGSRRHLMLDADGQFSSGGRDLLDLSEDE